MACKEIHGHLAFFTRKEIIDTDCGNISSLYKRLFSRSTLQRSLQSPFPHLTNVCFGAEAEALIEWLSVLYSIPCAHFVILEKCNPCRIIHLQVNLLRSAGQQHRNSKASNGTEVVLCKIFSKPWIFFFCLNTWCCVKVVCLFVFPLKASA